MLYPQTLFQCDCDSKGMKTVLKPDYYFNTSTLPSSKIQKGAITRAGYSICIEFHWVGAWLNEQRDKYCWVI